MKYTPRGLRQRGKDSGKWECTLSHKDPLTGRTVRSYHTIEAKTRKQAERKRGELIRELESRGLAADSKQTVGEYLDSYLDAREASGSLEPSTVSDYRADAKYVKRYLGSEPLADMSMDAIEKWMAQMTAEGYAPRTVTKAFRVLKQALKRAVANGLLEKNPADFCKPPKRRKTRINALDRGERSLVLELAYEAEPDPLAVAIELGLVTGMRREEICALRYGDINPDASITVRRAIGEAAGGTYVKGPKNEGSERVIPLDGHTYSLLTAMRGAARRTCRGQRAGDVGEIYVLGEQRPGGRYFAPCRLTKGFKAFCRANGLGDHKFGDLRHTYATMLVAQGADPSSVASLMGHQTVSMTLDVYATADPQARRAAADSVTRAFDVDMSAPAGACGAAAAPDPARGKRELARELAGMFTADQLRAMLELKRGSAEAGAD